MAVSKDRIFFVATEENYIISEHLLVRGDPAALNYEVPPVQCKETTHIRGGNQFS